MFNFLLQLFCFCFKILLTYGIIFATVMAVNSKETGWIHDSAALGFTRNFLEHMFY